MNLLVVGSGGREHALVRKLAGDAPGATIFCAPGNPGTAEHGINVPISTGDLSGLTRFARAEAIDLTVVGPEQPLAEGLADAFIASGLPIFGPVAAAARIEASKSFSKQLMQECGIPTARFRVFDDPDAARGFAAGLDAPLVVKASGLAGGKGAVVCASHAEADVTIRDMMERETLGAAGTEVVIEEFMEGEELSVFFITDGSEAAALAPARDHKRRFPGDLGPNTGGMGAFSPVQGADDSLIERVRREIAEPVLSGLAERGAPYRGFLYAGLMLTKHGPKVIEFNCRLGDPETQAVLPLLEDGLLEPLLAIGRGGALDGWRPVAPTRAALTTVVVSGTYPGDVQTRLPIDLPADLDSSEVHVYHAGTAIEDGRLVTAGGRVFSVTGIGSDMAEAASRSRAGAARIRFEGADWRSDIGHSEIG
ncbi:MAG: phosphoribosylamine--glycine ligase [Gemmatimonadales bacterium]|nr:MAG: phosphoribosylamine--glycine ligase [Gemmatimonadales bacterium]